MAETIEYGKWLGDKIYYIEPNYQIMDNKQTPDFFKKNDEDYCICVDLEVESYSRNKGFAKSDNNKKLVLSYRSNNPGTVSFLQGKSFSFSDGELRVLTTDYTNTHYLDITKEVGSEMFGIESIDVQYNNWFVPEIIIKFTDIKGTSLFAPEELRHNKTLGGIKGVAENDIGGSFFKCFFEFPYPKFTLLLKGFYGQPVTYELTCHDFRASFNSTNGNFDVTAKFVGFDFSFLNDISLNAIIAAPDSPYIGAEYWEQSQGHFKKLDEMGEYSVGLPKISDMIGDLQAYLTEMNGTNQAEGSPGQIVSQNTAEIDTMKSIKMSYNKLMEDMYSILSKTPTSDRHICVIEDEKYGLLIMDCGCENEKIKDAYKSVSATTTIDSINESIRNLNGDGKRSIPYIDNFLELEPFDLFEKSSDGSLEIKGGTDYSKYAEDTTTNGLESKIVQYITYFVENAHNVDNNRKGDSGYTTYATAYSSTKWYLINNVSTIVALQNETQKATQALENAKCELQEKINNLTIGGDRSIVPNIENITRVVMAHLETYLYMIYKSSDIVINNKRKFKDVGAVAFKTDLNSNDYLGPYPQIQQEDLKNTSDSDASGAEISWWIGDIVPNGINQPEAQVVEGLLQATDLIQDRIKTASEAISAMNENSQSEVSKSINYPLIPYDFILNSDCFNSNNPLDNDNPCDDILSRLFIRMVNIFNISSIAVKYNKEHNTFSVQDDFMSSDNAKLLGKMDALNFKSKFGADNSAFKKIDQKSPEQYITAFVRENERFWSCTNGGGILKYSDSNYKLNSDVFKHAFPLCNMSLQEAIEDCESNDGGAKVSNSDNYVLSEYNKNYTNEQNYYKNSCKVFIGDELKRFQNLNGGNEEYNNYLNKFFEDIKVSDSENVIPTECKFTNYKLNSNGAFDYDKYKFLRTKIKNDIYQKLTSNDLFDSEDIIKEIKSKKCILHILPTSKSKVGKLIDGDENWYKKIGDENQYSVKLKIFDTETKTIKIYDDEEDYTIEGFKEYLETANSLKSSSLDNLTLTYFPTYAIKLLEKATKTIKTSYFLGNSFYKFKTKEGKAIGMLLGVLGGFRGAKSVNENFMTIKNFTKMPYFRLLLLGGLSLMSNDKYKEKFKSDNEYLTSTIIGETEIKRQLELISVLNNWFAQTLEERFKNFIDNEFDEILNAFVPKINGKEVEDYDDLCKAFQYEKSKKSVREYLKELDNNFFENYMYFNDSGTLYLRQDSPMVQKLTKLFFTQTMIVVPILFSFKSTPLDTYFIVGENSRVMGAYKSYISSFLDELKPKEETSEETTNLNGSISDDTKLKHIKNALYKYTKNFYDRWCGGEDFESWQLDNTMKNFHFIDCYYNKIGHKCMVNMQEFYDFITASETSTNEEQYYSVATFLQQLFSRSNVNFVTVQNFIDLGSQDWAKNMGQMFEPVSYLDMKKPSNRCHFVGMYQSDTSQHLDIENAEYKDDSFLLNKEETWPKAITNKTDTNGYPIPAFGVSYGSQYQSYFTSINVGMDAPMVTEQSLKAQFFIADKAKGGGTNSTLLGQDLYTIYSNNSYECTIKMMGCAWVQPLMYFTLLNVPMFKGSYLIKKVSHSVKPGFMETTITGVRMANVMTPFVDSPLNLITGNNYGSYGGMSDFLSYQHKQGNINNTCGYASYPLYTIESEGGYETDFINRPLTSFGVTDILSAKIGSTATLLDGLTAIATLEAGADSEKPLGLKLVMAVLFNRLKKFTNGNISSLTKNIFEKNWFNPWTPSVINGMNLDSFKKNKPLMAEILQSTPSILANSDITITTSKHCKLKDGRDSKEASQNRKITLDDLEKIYFFATPATYKEIEKDHTTFLFQYQGHCFGKNSDDKKYWEYKEIEKTQVENGDKISDLAKGFASVLQQTIDNTDATSGVTISYDFVKDEKPNMIMIKSSDVSKNSIIFDMILQSYYKNIKNLYWCSHNASSLGEDNPISIRVEVIEDGDGIDRYVGLGWLNNTKDIQAYATSYGKNFPKNFLMSLSKTYSMDVNTAKRECFCFSKNSTDDISKILNENTALGCGMVGGTIASGAILDTEIVTSAKYHHCIDKHSRWGSNVGCGDITPTEQAERRRRLFNGCSTPSEIVSRYGESGVRNNFLTTFDIDTSNGQKFSVTAHTALKEDIIKIFNEIKAQGFPIYALKSFKWRTTDSGNQSNHSFGIALDLNARHNPKVPDNVCDYLNPYSGGHKDGGYDLQPGVDDTLHIRTPNHPIVKIFVKYGWGWGGYYGDYMHFSYVGGH